MTALDAAIRARLDDAHEDWCDKRDPLMAEDDRECNCGMRRLAGALRAVLDECARCRAPGVTMAPVVVQLLVARALGVDVPAEGGRS